MSRRRARAIIGGPRRARTTSVLPIERLWLPLASSAFITHSPIASGAARGACRSSSAYVALSTAGVSLNCGLVAHAGVFGQPPAVDAVHSPLACGIGRVDGEERWLSRPTSREPATVVRSMASMRSATATATAMRRTMSTMTNQAARRGGFFNRVYQVATVTVAGAGTDAVRAVCSAPATAFRQGMPLVVDYGDCSDAPEAEAVRAHLGLLRDAQLLPLGVSNVSSELSRELAAAGVPTLFSSGAKPGGDGGRAARRPASRAEPEPPPPPKAKSSAAASAAAATTQLHFGSVRSGEQVYAEGASLCVLGAVHSGAEVLADGDVFVSGDLSGRALCGRGGLDTARLIAAGRFNAELVSVAGVYLLGDSVPERIDRKRSLSVALRGSSLVIEQDGVVCVAE